MGVEEEKAIVLVLQAFKNHQLLQQVHLPWALVIHPVKDRKQQGFLFLQVWEHTPATLWQQGMTLVVMFLLP